MQQEVVSYRVHPFSDRTFFLLVDTWSDWFDSISHLLPDPDQLSPHFHCVEKDGSFFVFSLDGAIAGTGESEDEAARDGVQRLLFRMSMGSAQLDLTLN